MIKFVISFIFIILILIYDACMYNACKTHLHTKQWEKLFYPWHTSRKFFITPEPYTRLLRKWSQSVRKTWKKKVTKSRQKKNRFANREKCRGGLIQPPPPAFFRFKDQPKKDKFSPPGRYFIDSFFNSEI